MLVAAAAGTGVGQGADHAHQIGCYRGGGGHIGHGDGGDTTLTHAFDKTLPRTAGNQDFDAIQRMGAALEMMNRLLFAEFEAPDLFRLPSRFAFKQQKAAGMTGMARDGFKIFTDDGEFHKQLLR